MPTGQPGLASDDATKAELLNNYLTSAYTVDDGNTPTLARQLPDSAKLNDTSYPTDVGNCIKKLRPKFSTGPDGLSPFVIKKIGVSIVEPLSRFFNAFMSVGQVPSEWRTAYRLTSVGANYRPVSLVVYVNCEVMEHIIVLKMLDYLRKCNIISQQQHGFLSRRSTVTNLVATE